MGLVSASGGIRLAGCSESGFVIALLVARSKSFSLFRRRNLVSRTTSLHHLKCHSSASLFHLLSVSSPDLCSVVFSSASRRAVSPASDLGQFLQSDLLRLSPWWAWSIKISFWGSFGLYNFVGFFGMWPNGNVFLACPNWPPVRTTLLVVVESNHGAFVRRLPLRFQTTFGHRFTGFSSGYFSGISFGYFSGISFGYFSGVSIEYSSDLFTGYFSGCSLLEFETESICVQSKTTSASLDSNLFQRRLLTGYFSGFLMPAFEVASGCSQPRTTFVGSIVVLTSQCMVTISSPVDDYVWNTFSLMGMLVIVCFDISPGTLSSSVVLVSLCSFYVCSGVFTPKLAFRVCPIKLLLPFVSF
ncbi:hypothetical protein ISN45_Aa08g016150 [Arabidopsis thaliana x Arabidopsis arenosa]|uniref:Uncharacterized protein n=1 Tax=Arabidopsis thaliana x Arabidopsis arenosa TaxID=1240361 RepID=A0A8T1XJR7_9BRAS|nr:hypothetical protein ISN45_Aa08g016150 [Arabidopsis thaliana x Arabidopsis arenosa]